VAPLRIGTRGSALARAQTDLVTELLRERAPEIETQVVVVAVSGDARAAEGGGAPDKSRWVDRIEDSLRAERIDLAVHSAKDVPGELAPGLALLGAPQRPDARDALCGARSIAALPPGARVGTSSLRRASQLRAVREDIEVRALHGNVDTRLRHLSDGTYEAIVLAYAGLLRLGRHVDAQAQPLDAYEFVPAPGQGILALEGRADDERTSAAVATITDTRAICELAAERALVRTLGATCRTPVGAHARSGPDDSVLELSAFVGLPDGSAWSRDLLRGPVDDPEGLGRRVGERLLAAGARELLQRAEELTLERT
jgi:hydroxymethylbilane synthase